MYACMHIGSRNDSITHFKVYLYTYILTVGECLWINSHSYVCTYCMYVCMYVADTVSPSSSAGHPLKGKHRKSASMSALNYPALLPKSSEQVHIGKEGPNTNSGTDILSA